MSPETPEPKSDETPNPNAPLTERQTAWAMGWIFICLGLTIGCFTIGWPLYQAHNRAPEISISLKWTVIPIFLLVFGAADVVGIKVFGKMFEDEHHVTFFDIVRLLALTAIGLGAEWVLKRYVESLGYYFPI